VSGLFSSGFGSGRLILAESLIEGTLFIVFQFVWNFTMAPPTSSLHEVVARWCKEAAKEHVQNEIYTCHTDTLQIKSYCLLFITLSGKKIKKFKISNDSGMRVLLRASLISRSCFSFSSGRLKVLITHRTVSVSISIILTM
jgi:hypothetical protein